jgi:hypothetical protein
MMYPKRKATELWPSLFHLTIYTVFSILLPQPAGATTLTITKYIEFTTFATAFEFGEADYERENNGKGAGILTYGPNYAKSANPAASATKAAETYNFNSLNGSPQGAHSYSIEAGQSKATTVIAATAPVPVPNTDKATITAGIYGEVTVPNKNPDGTGGGAAEARGKVSIADVRGKLTKIISNGGVTQIINKPIEQVVFQLGSASVVLDPTYFSATDLATGETIGGLVYQDSYSGWGGAMLGIDGSGMFSLAIPDNLAISACAVFESQTLVTFATNLTGTVSLCNGKLSVSGMFDPGLGDITDLFDLTFSALDPTYIIRASYKFTDKLGDLSFSPEFLSPLTTGDDLVQIAMASDLTVDLSISEPSSAALVPLGVAAIGLVRRKSRRLARQQPA